MKQVPKSSHRSVTWTNVDSGKTSQGSKAYFAKGLALLAWDTSNSGPLSNRVKLTSFLEKMNKVPSSKTFAKLVMDASRQNTAELVLRVAMIAASSSESNNVTEGALALLRGIQAHLWDQVRSRKIKPCVSSQAIDAFAHVQDVNDRQDLFDAILTATYLALRFGSYALKNKEAANDMSLTVPLHSIMPLSSASTKYPGVAHWILIAVENAYSMSQIIDMMILLKAGELHGKGRLEKRAQYFAGANDLFDEVYTRIRERLRETVPKGIQALVPKVIRESLVALDPRSHAWALASDCIIALVHLIHVT